MIFLALITLSDLFHHHSFTTGCRSRQITCSFNFYHAHAASTKFERADDGIMWISMLTELAAPKIVVPAGTLTAMPFIVKLTTG